VASEAKQRMLNSAVVLLRERGAAGVSIDAVLAHSGAPRGSVYHHFPGGRAELIISAARLAGDYISGLLDTAIGSGDAARTVTKFSEFWKRSLHDSDFRAGCPVVALAVDSRDTLPEAAALVNEIFLTWQEKLTELLASDGRDRERAGRQATLIVAAIEGAIVLARAQRSDEPLNRVADELLALIA